MLLPVVVLQAAASVQAHGHAVDAVEEGQLSDAEPHDAAPRDRAELLVAQVAVGAVGELPDGAVHGDAGDDVVDHLALGVVRDA